MISRSLQFPSSGSVVVKGSRSLSHLLMSACTNIYRNILHALIMSVTVFSCVSILLAIFDLCSLLYWCCFYHCIDLYWSILLQSCQSVFNKLTYLLTYLRTLVVRASDWSLNGLEFDPRPPHHRSVGTGMGDRLQAGIPPRYVTSHPDQLSLCGMGNEYRPKCGDALRLGIKGRMINMWVASKTVWSDLYISSSTSFWWSDR